MTAGRMPSTPSPVLADTMTQSLAATSKAACIWAATMATSAEGRSILLTTGTRARPCSNAKKKLATVCRAAAGPRGGGGGSGVAAAELSAGPGRPGGRGGSGGPAAEL